VAFLKSLTITPIQKNGDSALMGSAWTLYHEMLFYTFVFIALILFPKFIKKYGGNFFAFFGLVWYALIYLSPIYEIKVNFLLNSTYEMKNYLRF
jgi:peptidoglycan/LPS O-acetylase OafA/YrhL